MKEDDDRKFLWDGDVTFILKKKTKTRLACFGTNLLHCHRHMFLFSDKLIFAQKKNKKIEKFTVKEYYNLPEIKAIKDSLSGTHFVYLVLTSM